MRAGTESLSTLTQEIIARGWHRKATWQVSAELLLNLMAVFGGIWIYLAHNAPTIRICALVVLTAGSMGVLTNTHTSSHYATSNRRWINELLTFLGYPMFIGVSACYWWHKHIDLHHPAPNVVGFDSDVDLSPWFARTKDQAEGSSGWRRVYYRRIQFLCLPFALAFIAFNMQIAGWRTLLSGLPQTRTKRKKWIDVLALISHYLLWIVIPSVFFPPLHVLAFYALRIGLIGYAMFAVLAPAHFPWEAVCLKNDGQKRDRLLLQTATTVNFQTGFVGRLICSGLEYQIEHHLFPGISHVYYRKMSPLVREFCRNKGLPYRSYPWHVALWKCFRVFHSPPAIQTNLEALRSAATTAEA